MPNEVASLTLAVKSDSVSRASDRLTTLDKQATRARDATGKFTKSSASATSSMVAMAARATVAYFSIRTLTGGISKGVRVNMQFEESMSAVEAVTRATDSQMLKLTATARKLGATTRFSASEAADGMKFLGQAGFETSEIIEAMPGLLDLATAGMLGLGEAADITSNIMSGFGLEAEESSRIADVLAAASSSANTNVQQLGEGMKFVAPISAALGVSVESTAAAMGVLSDAGLQSTMAGTGLRRVLSELANVSSAGQKVLEGYGLTLEELDPKTNSLTDIVEKLSEVGLGAAEAFTIFGDRGAPAILALTSQTDRLRELNTEMENSAGRAKEMAGVMGDNLAGDVKILKSVLEELTLAGGEKGVNGTLRALTQTSALAFQAIAKGIEDVNFKEIFLEMQSLEDRLEGLGQRSDMSAVKQVAELKEELEGLKETLGDEISAKGFGALGRLDLELKGVMQTLSKELTELQDHPIKNFDPFGVKADKVAGELATATAAYEKALDAQAMLAQAQAEEQKVLDAEAAEGQERQAEKAEAIRKVAEAKKIAEQSVNLSRVEESLKSEEQLIRDSYQRRLQVVLDNTAEGSQVRAELSERLREQMGQELETLQTSEASKVESLRVSLLTQEEALQESYDARKALILESTSTTEAEKGDLMARLDKKFAADQHKADLNRWKTALSSFDDFQNNLLILARTGNSTLSAVYKTAAIANTTIKTYESATSAYAALAGIPVVGPALGTAAAAAAVAAGMANVAAISSTNAGSFAAGGTIREGQYGLVGEAGPEIVQGPAKVTSAADTARKLGDTPPAAKPVTVVIENYGDSEATVERTETDREEIIRVAVGRSVDEINNNIRTGQGGTERALQVRDKRVG